MVVLTNMIAILMVSAKMVTPGLLKKSYIEIKVMTLQFLIMMPPTTFVM